MEGLLTQARIQNNVDGLREMADGVLSVLGVKKGSFYYFFKSKADVAVAALDATFKEKRIELDAMFSPMVPPLDRIRQYCEFSRKMQVETQEKWGFVLGCPLCTLGAEVSTQEQELRAKIQEILEHKAKYLETAIRDAHAAGVVDAPDAAAKSRVVWAYMEGLLTQARIQNNVDGLREMADGVLSVLGVKSVQAVTV